MTHRLVLFALCGASLFVLAAPLSAANSSITVAVQSIGCTTSAGSDSFNAQSWSFGSLDSSGRISLQNLVVTRLFDGCSAALFGASVSGTHYASLTLTQRTLASPPTTTLTVRLTNALVVIYQVSGASTAQLPAETVSLTFDQITITDPQNNSSFCWDNVIGKKC